MTSPQGPGGEESSPGEAAGVYDALGGIGALGEDGGAGFAERVSDPEDATGFPVAVDKGTLAALVRHYQGSGFPEVTVSAELGETAADDADAAANALLGGSSVYPTAGGLALGFGLPPGEEADVLWGRFQALNQPDQTGSDASGARGGAFIGSMKPEADVTGLSGGGES